MRWFAGKGRLISEVKVVTDPFVTGAGQWPAVRREDAVVSYADGTTEIYQLLSAYRPLDEADSQHTLATVEVGGLGAVALGDATTDPPAFNAFLDTFDFHPDVERGSVHLFTGEQSNTSVRIGPNALFKMLRRLQPGPNREADILRLLNTSGVSPRLFGQNYTAEGTTVSIVMEFIEADGDGWELASSSCRANTDFTTLATDLGSALRTVHQALGRAQGVTAASGAHISAAMLARLEQAVAEVPQIAAVAEPLRVIFSRVSTQELGLQLVHGDFHLGQALHRSDPPGWVVLDFEGEPLKTPAERDEPDSVWRDVAGALRSFEYARGVHPEPDSDVAKAWCAHARAAFLAGYAQGEPIPSDLLRAYELDKAVYEVRYELRNRPEWAYIPLCSVQDELFGLPGNPPAQA